MTNILGTLIQAARSGGNPMQVLGGMAQGNHIMQQGANMIAGKSPQELEQLARNMAKQRGVDIDQMIEQLGLR